MLSESLRCHSYGDPLKPNMVLLHGFLGSGLDFEAVIDALGEQFHLWLIDLPGHGDSALLEFPSENALEYINQLLLATLHKYAIDRYHLLGYSLGGRIALYHASRCPDGLLSLTLEAAHPGLLHDAEKAERIVSDQRWAVRFAREPLHDVLEDWYQQPVFASLDDSQREVLVIRRCAVNQGTALAHVLDGVSLARQPDLWPFLHKPTVPTTYFAPGKDAKFHALGERIERECPLVKVKTFADAGHNIHWESPLQWSRQLIETIQEANYAG